MKPKQKIARKQFTYGDSPDCDFTKQDIENLILRLALWFQDPRCDRNFPDTQASARKVVEAALLCEKLDGSPWVNGPHKFETRIKVLAAFDMETGEGIPISAAKHPMAGRRLDAEAKQGAKQLNQLSPELSTFDIQEFRDGEERKLLNQYPELNNPVHLPHVRRLTLLYAQQEMMDRELILQPKRRSEILKEMEKLTSTVDAVMKTLDIHPESLRKRMKEREDGTLGDLVQIMDSDEEFKERDRLWSLQEALQLWYMTQHPNGRGDGPQLTDWELWHMTRSRPITFTCKCGKHYPSIVQGFTPKELKAYLISKGVLVAKSVIPNLIPEDSLKGIEEHIDSLPD